MRRAYNMISKLRDMESEWLSIVDTIITGEMNIKLLRPMTYKEVRKVTFSMGIPKVLGPYGFLGIFFFRNIGIWWERMCFML